MRDKITYEFTLASGDVDWSDCNLDIERNGKKIWLASLGSERKFDVFAKEFSYEDWLTYEDLERLALLFCHAEEMYQLLKDLKEEFELYSSDCFDDEQRGSSMNFAIGRIESLLEKLEVKDE